MAEQKKAATSTNRVTKVTLVELLTILLLVGLVFVFVIPVNQAKKSQKRLNEAIQVMNMVSEKADAFKNNPDNGYYPDISQLNLGDQIKSDYFEFSINTDDSTMVAVTKPAFGKKDVYLVLNLGSKQYSIGKDNADLISKKYISENWLP